MKNIDKDTRILSNELTGTTIFVDAGDPATNDIEDSLVASRKRRGFIDDFGNIDTTTATDRWSILSKIGGNKKITIPAGITVAAVAIGLVATGVGNNKNNSNTIPQANAAGLTEHRAFTTHTVQSGETLEGIAKADLIERASKQEFSLEPTPGQIDVREREIAAENGLENPDELMPGQVLNIPQASEVPIGFRQPD